MLNQARILILVVLRGEVSPCEEIARTIEDVADVSLHHNEVVSCVFISAEQFEHERSPLVLNIGVFCPNPRKGIFQG
jgi:hypothetical protein